MSVKYAALSRCSSEEQKRKGFSHDTQLGNIKSHPKAKDWNCVGEFSETVSAWGKNGVKERKTLKKIYEKVQRNPFWIDFLLLQKVDRLSRDIRVGMDWIEKFRKYGVEINFTDQWIDYGSGASNILLGLYLGQAADESVRKSNRVKDTLEQIKRQGYWTFGRPPVGYKKVQYLDTSRKTLVPDEEKYEIIQEALLVFNEDKFKTIYLFEKYGKKAGLSRSGFYYLFEKALYAGIIICPEYKQFSATTIKSKWYEHRMIDSDVYYANMEIVQSRKLKESKSTHPIGKIQKDIYFLKGHLFEFTTGLPMTASGTTKKRTGKTFHYYHVPQNKKGTKRVPVHVAHGLVSKVLNELKLDDLLIEEVKKKIKVGLAKTRELAKKRITRIAKELDKYQVSLNKLKSNFATGEVTIEEYRDIKSHVEIKITECEEKIKTEKAKLAKLEGQIYKIPDVLSKLGSIFKKVDYNGKDVILSTIFPNGFKINEDFSKIRTTNLNSVVLEFPDFKGFCKYIEVEHYPDLGNVPVVYPRLESNQHVQ